MFFSLLISSFSAEKQCTARHTLYSVTKDNYTDYIGQGKPIFLRMQNAGCPYAGPSEASWQEAAELYPNLQFVYVECIYNYDVCAKYSKEKPVTSPSHAVLDGNGERLYYVGNSISFRYSSSAYGEIVQKQLGFYPFDSAPMEQLFPFTTDDFYKRYDYPIFILYDSQCQEDIDFVANWLKVAIEDLMDEDVDYGFGRIDCSQYEEECKRWGQTTTYPKAVIYSQATGSRVNLDDDTYIVTKLHTRIEALQSSTTEQPTPTPAPTAKPEPEPEPIQPSTTIELDESLNEPIATLKDE